MFSFGSGVLFGRRTDIANASPINVGTVQNVSIEETADTKELRGQFQRPIAIARSTIKTAGKASMARVSGLALANLFYGIAPTTGQNSFAFNEPGAIPGASTYTVTAAQGVNMSADWGVTYAATGLPLTRVTAAPAVGQYSVNTATGVYTFAAADAGKAVLLNYAYTLPALGISLAVGNQLAGFTPTWAMQFFTTFQGQTVTITYPNCVSSKFTFDPKLEDFVTPDLDFQCFADASGNVATWSFSEAS